MIRNFSLCRILMIVAILSVTACGNDYSNVAEHNIEKQECMGPFKCSYDVRIQNRLSEQDLSQIANKIKDEAPVVENVFINYYLPCMKIGNGAWASARFTPDLYVSLQEFNVENNPTCETPEQN